MRGQQELNLGKGKRGGRRPGAGRKPLHSKGVAHRKREKVLLRHPLHITFKVRASIRNRPCLKILRRAIRNALSRGLSVLHFSLQSNHVHLIVEARSNAVLTRGMRTLTITFSKGIAKGRIQVERYHLHVLKTIRETRNAVHYVLFNQQKHAGLKRAYVDQYSSLELVQDLRSLAKKAGMTIILRKIKQEICLVPPEGWIIRRVLDEAY